ncbi:MAG: hypothetical protein ACLT38_06810 [Akkermansia sp.]
MREKKLKNQDVSHGRLTRHFPSFAGGTSITLIENFIPYASSEHIRNIHSQPCIAASKNAQTSSHTDSGTTGSLLEKSRPVSVFQPLFSLLF